MLGTKKLWRCGQEASKSGQNVIIANWWTLSDTTNLKKFWGLAPADWGYSLVISRDALEMETFCSSNKSIGWKGTVGNRYNYTTQSLLHLSLHKVVICLLLVLPLEESGVQFYKLAVLQVRTFFSISGLCHSRPINAHVFLCQFSLNNSSLLLLFPPVTRINPMM